MWSEVTQNMIYWYAVLNTVMNFKFPQTQSVCWITTSRVNFFAVWHSAVSFSIHIHMADCLLYRWEVHRSVPPNAWPVILHWVTCKEGDHPGVHILLCNNSDHSIRVWSNWNAGLRRQCYPSLLFCHCNQDVSQQDLSDCVLLVHNSHLCIPPINSSWNFQLISDPCCS